MDLAEMLQRKGDKEHKQKAYKDIQYTKNYLTGEGKFSSVKKPNM